MDATQDELRGLFAASGFLEMFEQGALTEGEARSRPCGSHLDFPAGSRSRRVQWLDSDGEQVAIVHYYVGPDGSRLTMPDPKWLKVGDDVFKFVLSPSGEPPAED